MEKTDLNDHSIWDGLAIKNLQEPPSSWSEIEGQKLSAVLCLIVKYHPDDKDSYLLLNKRSLTVRTHKGQIGFPGGHREDHDIDPVATAIRETHEEIGIEASKIEVLGSLPFVNSMNGAPVIPIAAKAIIDPKELVLSKDEVAEAIFAPIDLFLNGQEKKVGFRMFGIKRESYLYKHHHHLVWGLTAKMIHGAHFYRLAAD